MIDNGGYVNSVSVSNSDDTSSDSEEEEVSNTVQEFDESNYGSQAIDLPSTMEASNLATTVVKMKNSSNVEIKPVTQVTIHQYFQNSDQSKLPNDAIPNQKEDSTQSATSKANCYKEPEPYVPPNTPGKKFYHGIASRVPKKLGIILILTVSVMTIVVIAVCVTLPGNNNTLPDATGMVPEETQYDLGNDIHILTRKRWGGRDIRNGYQNRTLVHPIKLVIIGHTASPMCMTHRQCAQRLQSIQTAHVSDNGYVDIGYNFLVGGDANIYQALGWDIRNYLRNNSIQIQFVGNYGFDEVLDRQRMAAQALLKHGVEIGKLANDYLLVGHNQVDNTESPGKFLKADIKNWPHYYNGTVT